MHAEFHSSSSIIEEFENLFLHGLWYPKIRWYKKKKPKQGSGAEDSVGPHSGVPVLLWPTMKIWIVCFHF